MTTPQYSKHGNPNAYSLFSDNESSMKIMRLKDKGKLTNQKVLELYQLKSGKFQKNYNPQSKYNLGRVKSLKPKRSDSQGIDKKDKFLTSKHYSKQLKKSSAQQKFKSRIDDKLKAKKLVGRNTRGNSSTKDYSHKTIDKFTSHLAKDYVIQKTNSHEKSDDENLTNLKKKNHRMRIKKLIEHTSDQKLSSPYLENSNYKYKSKIKQKRGSNDWIYIPGESMEKQTDQSLKLGSATKYLDTDYKQNNNGAVRASNDRNKDLLRYSSMQRLRNTNSDEEQSKPALKNLKTLNFGGINSPNITKYGKNYPQTASSKHQKSNPAALYFSKKRSLASTSQYKSQKEIHDYFGRKKESSFLNTSKSNHNTKGKKKIDLREKLSNLEKRRSKNNRPSWKQHLQVSKLNLSKNPGNKKSGVETFSNLNKNDLIKIILEQGIEIDYIKKLTEDKGNNLRGRLSRANSNQNLRKSKNILNRDKKLARFKNSRGQKSYKSHSKIRYQSKEPARRFNGEGSVNTKHYKNIQNLKLIGRNEILLENNFTPEISDQENNQFGQSINGFDGNDVPMTSYLKDYAMNSAYSKKRQQTREQKLSQQGLSSVKNQDPILSTEYRSIDNFNPRNSQEQPPSLRNEAENLIDRGFEEIKTKFGQILEFNKYLVTKMTELQKANMALKGAKS